MDTTRLFDGLAERYQRFRPSYPKQLLEELKGFLEAGRNQGWPEKPIVADIGAGTGISTRLLREVLAGDFAFFGIEPCEDMRERARTETPVDLQIEYVDGQAEKLPFENGTAALIFAAQAAHWFEREAFYAEAHRVLAHGAVLAIIFNNRQWQDCPRMEVYEQFLETYAEGHTRYYRNIQFELELPRAEGYVAYERLEKTWQRRMTVGDFIEMSLSTTRLQPIVKEAGEKAVIERLTDVLGGDREEVISVPYITELYVLRKSEH